MATKLKKRRPGLTFAFFVGAVSAIIVCTAAAISLWNPWNMAADYKETEQYNETVTTLLYEATRAAMDIPTEDGRAAEARAAEESGNYDAAIEDNMYTATLANGESYTVVFAENSPTLAGEGTNISYFLQGRNGTVRHGEDEAQTQAQFEAAVRGSSNLDDNGVLSNFDASNQGEYAHLIILDKSGLREWKNTRFGFVVHSSTLARSDYAWIFPTEMRQLLGNPEFQDVSVTLAIRAEQRLDNAGGIYSAYYSWYQSMRQFVVALVVGGAAILILLITLLKFRSLSIANHAIARFFGRFWVEPKLLITAGALYLGIEQLYFTAYYDVGSILPFLPCFWWCWCILLDVCSNKGAFFTNNSVASCIRFYRTLESKHPFLERMKKRAGLLLAAEVILVILAAVMVVFSEPSFTNTLPVFVCIGLVIIGFALLFLYIRGYNREMDEFGEIVNYAHKIRVGGAAEPLKVKPESALCTLADDLNEIHSGINSAVEERVRSEKMKAELVTNVSHDLKTPLTSIINYIGLLDKEELSPAYTNDYVDILGQKSQRLKNLVQDLFEVSKANSGAVEMKPEQLDVVSLIEQTIAELDERAERAGVELKTQFAAQRIYAVADGRQLHRVFENLLGNALKYSLAGTRVYVAARDVENGAEITFKNIAGYEMNFSAEDIVERFQRGDASRTTEGSGLGLAIAKSFVELNHGTLKIELDGDLFKATVFLPAAFGDTPIAKKKVIAAEPVSMTEQAGAMDEISGMLKEVESVTEQETEAVAVEQAVAAMEQEFSLNEVLTPVEPISMASPETQAEPVSQVEPVPMEEPENSSEAVTGNPMDAAPSESPEEPGKTVEQAAEAAKE